MLKWGAKYTQAAFNIPSRTAQVNYTCGKHYLPLKIETALLMGFHFSLVGTFFGSAMLKKWLHMI